jgi:hypothetical protein
MPLRPTLDHGQPVDAAASNQSLDRQDRLIPLSADMMVDGGETGVGMTSLKGIPAVWGRIKKRGPKKSPDFFEWDLVEKDDEGRWQLATDIQPGIAAAKYGSHLVGTSADEDDQVLLHPAVGINDDNPPIGTVVRLYPTRIIISTDKTLTGPDEDVWVHRAWLFSFGELRAFRLIDTMIPGLGNPEEFDINGEPKPVEGLDPDTGITDEAIAWHQVDPIPIEAPDDHLVDRGVRESQWRHRRLKGYWINQSEAELIREDDRVEVDLYPAHPNGFEVGEQYISLGLAWGEDEFDQGALGWAKWVPHGTALGYTDADAEGSFIIWRGEWQIVWLETETIVDAFNGGTTFQPNEMGFMDIIDIRRDGQNVTMNAAQGSGRNVVGTAFTFNDTAAPITVGSLHKLHFDKRLYIWRPISPLASSHGLSIYANATATAAALVTPVNIPFDNDVVGSDFGEAVERNGNKIKNVGEVALIGVVSYAVTAQRLIAGAAAVDSVLEAQLFNNGALVVGASRRSSSTRRVAGPGQAAVNSCGATVNQTLQPGEELEVKIEIFFQVDVNDQFITVADMCSLTFNSSVSVFLD